MGMEKKKLDHVEIAQLTEEYGGAWGINHTWRLLKLVAVIGEGLEYNQEAVWIAAHLHDWGAYAPWAQKEVDHEKRSVQVAEAFLSERDCPPELKALVLECIDRHHAYDTPSGSLESVLFREADVLDFLGVVGVLRDFSKNPRELRKALATCRQRRYKLPGALRLEKAKEIAVQRVQQMDELLERFEADSFGCY